MMRITTGEGMKTEGMRVGDDGGGEFRKGDGGAVKLRRIG